MSDSMVIKDLKDAYYMHSGLAFSADETYDLWAEFDARDRRIAELKEFINQLIEAGDAVINAEPMWIAEEDKWETLVKDWKEREK